MDPSLYNVLIWLTVSTQRRKCWTIGIFNLHNQKPAGKWASQSAWHTDLEHLF